VEQATQQRFGLAKPKGKFITVKIVGNHAGQSSPASLSIRRGRDELSSGTSKRFAYLSY